MMSRAVSQAESTHPQLRSLYAPIRAELDRVESLLGNELSSDFPFIDQLVKHGFRLGGKRLRPALVLLSGQACGEVRPEHPILAAVVELVHTATLIHDDVLDEATIRRHLDTVNARWNNETSVLLGDYLLARAICLTGSLESTYAYRVLGEASRVMCEGELRQVGSRGEFDLSEADYLSIVGAKTAALCACCCRLGAHYAGAAPELEETLAQYGYHLGVAFQIADDVLDVKGSEAVTGKSLGTDLMKQKPTLPLIRLLSQVGPQDRRDLLAILNTSDVHRLERLKPWFQRTDAVAYAQQQALACVARAKAQLDLIPPRPARDTLRQLADFVVTRQE
jgi:octaprenyl-diphosphate synthase